MPKFIENLLSYAGFVHKDKAASPSVSSSYSADPFTLWRTNRKIDPARALEAYSGWVYAAVKAISDEIGGIEHRLFKVGKDGDKELFEHDILNLLNGVNDYQTGLELKQITTAHLKMVGNAYWYLEGAADETTKPLAVHIMIPSKVKVLVNREEFPTRVQGYEYRLGSRVYKFKPHEVIHFKDPDPNDPHEGIGVAQTIAQWIDADNYAMEFNRRFFLNGARIGGFLKTDSAYTPDQLQYLKASFEAAFKGVENAYKVLALPKGTEYEEGGKTQKDMDFSNLSLAMRDRIIAGFKVPRTALGITDDVNRANAEATDYVFAARTIKPLMKLITAYLNEFLVPRYGQDIYLDFADPVPEDRAQKMDEMTKAVGAAPVISANEAREKYFGLEPVDGGDDVLVPFSLQPLSGGGGTDYGTPTGRSVSARVSARKISRGHFVKTRFAMNAEHRRTISKTIAEKAAAEVANILKDAAEVKDKARKNLSQLSDDEYEKLYKGFALRVTGYEKRQTSAVQDFNARQRREVLGNLPKIAKAIDKQDIFDLEESMAALIDLSKPILYDLAGKEGKEAAALLGIPDMDILSREVRAALDKAIELMSRKYNETTRDELKRALEKGLKEGLGQEELADLVSGIYEWSDDVRALAVARTETFRIANYSTQQAWKQSGVVKAQRWYTAADERVCPWCQPQHGKVVGIDEDFFKKGDEVTGSDGSKLPIDYSDVGAPPLHVSCRCYIRPDEISLE